MVTPAFTSIFDAVQPYTKSTPERMQSMVEALREVDSKGIPGDVVECGVWKGGNIMMARMVSPDRSCWLYDTFSGMTEPDPVFDTKRDGGRAIDKYRIRQKAKEPWMAVSVDEVKSSFAKMGLMEKCNFVVGDAEFTINPTAHFEGIAVLRLDMDWYWPTKAALERLYPRVSPGGFVIVDDYGHWMGARKAVDEYFKDDFPLMWEVDYSCVMFRRC